MPIRFYILVCGSFGWFYLAQTLLPLPLFFGHSMDDPHPLPWVPLLVGCCGAWMYYKADRALDSAISKRAQELGVRPVDAGFVVIDEGPWRFSRNPNYLASILFLLMFFFIFPNLHSLFVTFGFAVMLNYFIVLPDEVRMSEKFGQPYLDYLKTRRRWL